MKFESCTLIIDYKTPLVEHFIEKLISLGMQLDVYSFNSTTEDEEVRTCFKQLWAYSILFNGFF